MYHRVGDRWGKGYRRSGAFTSPPEPGIDLLLGIGQAIFVSNLAGGLLIFRSRRAALRCDVEVSGYRMVSRSAQANH